ncbi:hypothetical protein SFR_4958 [Streptomyces sp. FR-008]|nr:hypothetical protein SFR_4958 [Streptomyces sp. FR-008]
MRGYGWGHGTTVRGGGGVVGPGENPVCPVAKFRRVRLRRRTRPDGRGEGAGASPRLHFPAEN